MIQIQKNQQNRLPKEVTVACSGGVDSMAIVHFLSKKHTVTVAYFNHGNEFDHYSEQWLTEWCNTNGVNIITANITREKHSSESCEEYWRNQRYEWFHSMNCEVITAHHLDDCVETWIWSSMHGEGKIIPYRNRNVIRPFRLNTKDVFQSWCHRHNVEYLTDPSNVNTAHTRNYIRNTMMPHVLRVNPGINKVIRKKVMAEFP